MPSLSALYGIAPEYFYFGVVVLGLLVGSFLNVVIYRLPKMMQLEWDQQCAEYAAGKEEPISKQNSQVSPPETFNLAVPNSSCPNCKAPIKPWQNIPVVSYLFLKGACASCGIRISPRYPAIELTSGVLSGLLLWHFGATPQTYFGLIFVWSLICLTMIDIDHHLLPDDITLPLIWAGLIVNINGTYTTLTSAVIGAAAGYLSLWGVYWLFKLLTGKEGMGYGDFKLLAALGAWMGWQFLPVIVILSSMVGAVLGISAILLLGRDKAKPLPFGPYLAGAGLLAFLWGDEILKHYLQFAKLSV